MSENELTSLIYEVESLLITLKTPISEFEKENHWQHSTKEAYIIFFKDLLEHLKGGNDLPYVCLTRSLDAHGIHSGHLYHKMLDIMYQYRSYSNN